MADIFLSYAREDEARASAVARVLADCGWSVFWDRRIKAGSSWDEVIERELGSSKCVVVLWSATSIESRWVRTEAHFGLQRETLVPAKLDQSDPPLAFRFLEAAQLHEWTGNVDDPEFSVLTEGITQFVPATRTTSTPASKPSDLPRAVSPYLVSGETTHSRDDRTGAGWYVGLLRHWQIAVAVVLSGIVLSLILSRIINKGGEALPPDNPTTTSNPSLTAPAPAVPPTARPAPQAAPPSAPSGLRIQ